MWYYNRRGRGPRWRGFPWIFIVAIIVLTGTWGWHTFLPLLLIGGFVFFVIRSVMRNRGGGSMWGGPWSNPQNMQQPPQYQPPQQYQPPLYPSYPPYQPPYQPAAPPKEPSYVPYEQGYQAAPPAAPAEEQPRYQVPDAYEQPQTSYPEMMPPMEQ